MADVPTMKIESEDTGLGYRIINKEDFDPEVDKEYVEPEVKEPASGNPEGNPGPSGEKGSDGNQTPKTGGKSGQNPVK